MDYFYAQCEELRHAEYSGKPIIVGMFSGRTEISGAVATSNYPARKLGIRSGIPLATAKQLLKDTDHLLVKADFEYYESISQKIMNILKGYSEKFVQESIDEAFLDITNAVRGDYNRAAELATEIKDRIMKETGIRCSVGIAPNKLVAKMACDAAKPNGLVVVRPDNVQSFLEGKPVDSILGIGGKTAERLKQLGVTTVDQLAKLPLHRLQAEFGNKLGLYYYLAARGIDEEPLHEKEQDLERLRLAYKTVSIVVNDTSLKQHTRARTLKTIETNCSVAIEIAKGLLESFFSQQPDTVARRVGITLSSLAKVEGQKNITEFFNQG